MRKLILISLTLAGVLSLLPQSKGQDPNFSQFFSTPLYYNPAYTGINTGVRARFTFRDQWPNLPVDFRAYYFSADLGDRNLPGAGGFGIIVNEDNEGIGFIKDLYAGITLSVRIPLTSYMVSQIGIKACVVQKTVNWDDFVFSDQLSEKYGNIYATSFVPPDANKKVFPDFGVGGLLQFSNVESNVTGTAGFAVDHLFRPDQSFLSTASAPLPRKWVVHGDLVISAGSGKSSSGMYASGGANDPLKINPGIIYQNQDNLNSLELGLNLLKYNIYLGAWYKTTLKDNPNNVVALLVGYRYSFAEDMNIKFMYSYDLQVSGSLQGMGGSHEVSVILEFDKLSIFGGGRGGALGSPGRYRNNSPLECPSFY
ncbi:MAG TPA: PorP/SprF family type IX secretion system membrane protein [Bacteroidales bacterium]|nr:PorP/SprF family type IX secretion system membrane protein [Bacteroidales bacterium]